MKPASIPGAEVPNLSRRKPPKDGAITLVALSKEAERPKIPPNSIGGTALVSAELMIVFKIPAFMAMGNRTMSKNRIFGANAQARKLKAMMVVETNIIL